MSKFTDFISGGGDAAPIPTAQYVIGQSKTWTSPVTGRIKVILTGGGGQGAFLANVNGTVPFNYGDATGGGAGGYCAKTFNVTAGETFVVTIGAGGATALAPNSVTTSRIGNSAGNSSFVTGTAAESVNMVANGGGGGQYSASTTSIVTTAGGTGGTASGGDVNYTGGAGGTISRAVGNQYNCATTGGGAVSLYGTAFHGGDITMTVFFSSASKYMASGGAGVGGHGADILVDDTSNYAYLSQGGSATRDGPTTEVAHGTTVLTEVTLGGPYTGPTINVIDAQGSGGSSRFSPSGSIYGGGGGLGGGGGSGMGYISNTSSYYAGGLGGAFGGGGSVVAVGTSLYTSSNPIRAGLGGNGGGGSGAFSGPYATATSASGRQWAPGGDGICIIMVV